jgi:tryptophan halogenase
VDGVHAGRAAEGGGLRLVHRRPPARDDSGAGQYWKDTKTRAVPDGLAERLERWKVQLPDSETVFPYYHGLPPYSYMCILLGMGGIEVAHSPALSLSDETYAQKEFVEIRDKAERLVETLPTQHEYFSAMRS